MTYDEVFKDWSYLYDEIAPAHDMTGAYEDQHDLDRLLRSPSKYTAKKCLIRQIEYWFQAGPDVSANYFKSKRELERLIESDPEVMRIGEKYFCV